VGIHNGKTYLLTGVLTKRSIATSVAAELHAGGATLLVTSFDRARATTQRTLRSLSLNPEVLDYDASSPTSAEELADEVAQHTNALDGLLFAIAGAPKEALQRDLSRASAAQVGETLTTSALALSNLTFALAPQLRRAEDGASVVALTFSPHRVWPGYGWMGIAKATLESIVKHLAVELGPSAIRVNQVDAGPLRTAAARQIGGLSEAADYFGTIAPLGWDAADATAVASACSMLLSPLLKATTGTTLIVDGGAHLVGGSRDD
jgi:enoyl-[acyl-carrier protein] reductase I